jgi:hypothetical protein
MAIAKRINPATGEVEYYDTTNNMVIDIKKLGVVTPTQAQSEYMDSQNTGANLLGVPTPQKEIERMYKSGQISITGTNPNDLFEKPKLTTNPDESIYTDDTQDPNKKNQFQFPAINLAGSDLNSELYSLGMNIGKPAGMRGKGLGIAASAGAALLGATGDIMSGYGYQVASERNRKWYQDQMKKQQYAADDQYRDTNTVGGFPTYRFGGYFEDGGMADGEGLVEQTEENGDEPKISIEKLLTGENIKGLSEKGGMEANVEVEGDEYLQFPDGTTQRVVGKDHEEGGVKMNIPDGTKVISKTLKPNKKQTKELEKTYNLNVGKTDTYAEVVDKFANKIGLTKKYKEQEELFTALKDLFKDTKIAPATKRLNQDFLAGKIAKIENEKAELEAQKQEFFNAVFDMQEESKPEEERGQEVFKMGGTSYTGFYNLAEKHNVNPNDLMDVLRKAGATNLPKLDEGTKVFKARRVENEYRNQVVEPQHPNEKNYGTEKDNERIFKEWYRSFPDIIMDDKVFGKVIDKEKLKKGEPGFLSKIPLNKQNDLILEFQKRSNSRMRASAETITNNPDNFDPKTVELAKEFLKNELFTGEKNSKMSTAEQVRAYDSMLGNYTAGRHILSLDMVQPDESKELEKEGIFTLRQISDERLSKLSPATQKRIKQIRDIQGEDADFRLDTYTPETEPEKSTIPKPGPQPDPKKDTDLDVNLSGQKPYQSKMFYMPDQSTLPPSALKVGVNIQNTLQRMDPVRIGIEQNLQEASDTRQFIAEQLNGMPSAQRAAGMASLLASTQEGINKAIVDTNRINAANIAATEQFNTNISNEEQQLNANNLYSYDQRALKAEANTEEELRNWMDRNQKVALDNFRQQQRLNLYDASIPDYEINFMGLGVDYDQAYDWKVKTEARQKAQAEVAPKDLTKAGLEKVIQEYGIDPESIRFKSQQ